VSRAPLLLNSNQFSVLEVTELNVDEDAINEKMFSPGFCRM